MQIESLKGIEYGGLEAILPTNQISDLVGELISIIDLNQTYREFLRGSSADYMYNGSSHSVPIRVLMDYRYERSEEDAIVTFWPLNGRNGLREQSLEVVRQIQEKLTPYVRVSAQGSAANQGQPGKWQNLFSRLLPSLLRPSTS